MLKFAFPGQFYAVNQRGADVLGIKGYTSLKEIPGPVDFVFVQVPVKASVQVLKDCAAKGVKLVVLYTAGFSESENELGKELEQEILSIVHQGGVRLLGPNCMGVYNPSAHLTFGPLIQESGPVGVMCQSGGNSFQLVSAASERGVRFSKVISYGNAIDINEVELMEYFAQDPDTKIIITYIEGVRDGRRFYQALKSASQIKPVIVLKGGQTPAGAIATLSHTSSLAGSNQVWDSLIKQAGAIQANNIDECVDIAVALSFIKPPASRRTVVIGYGGGATVQAADDCYRANLQLPPIPADIKEDIKKAISFPGNIFKNPLDINPYWGLEKAKEAFTTVSKWDEADVIVLLSTPEQTPFMPRDWEYEVTTQTIIEWAKLSTKPTVLAMNVNTMPGEDGLAEKCFNQIANAGFAVFPSARRAAMALERVYRYNQWRKKRS